MADRTLTESGVIKSSTCTRDIFSGTTEALLTAGLIASHELTPQEGRPGGMTVFLSDGKPCPAHYCAWRDPGARIIRQFDDGSCRLDVNVSKEVRTQRRKERAAAEYEAGQELLNQNLATNGRMYRNWTLRHEFGDEVESWEGTKSQLQAEGIGVGLTFPGEPGGPRTLDCKCPLGFDVHIPQQHDEAKAAAGIYRAISRFLPWEPPTTQLVQFAPGVTQEEWNPQTRWNYDTYHGSAQALVSAGLVPDLSYFPGQPGRKKTQASYRADWSPLTTAKLTDWHVSIFLHRKTDQYTMKVALSEHEEARRTELHNTFEQETKLKQRELSSERRQLRSLAHGTDKAITDFRADRAQKLENWLGWLWNGVFGERDEPINFNISEDSALYNELLGACQTLRDAVQSADVTQNKAMASELQRRLKVTAAHNDKSVQALLRSAMNPLK